MTEAVLDASVVLKWFRTEGERNAKPAAALRAQFERGELLVLAPPLLGLEIVNVAGRSWKLDERALVTLAEALGELGIQFREPDPTRVATWTARGLTSYDAAYVALAEAEGITLISDDELVCAKAAWTAVPLSSIREREST
ncbi:MAG TPA: type II toxin-antitoxin system VapC family toxin [Candidatus Baltobacteraceae bacterium]|nr:type II toxin-antitoxin system VapC family toxin [Candidatus Baltobacteraceae bacterium]